MNWITHWTWCTCWTQLHWPSWLSSWQHNNTNQSSQYFHWSGLEQIKQEPIMRSFDLLLDANLVFCAPSSRPRWAPACMCRLLHGSLECPSGYIKSQYERPLYMDGLALIPACIRKYIHYQVWWNTFTILSNQCGSWRDHTVNLLKFTLPFELQNKNRLNLGGPES